MRGFSPVGFKEEVVLAHVVLSPPTYPHNIKYYVCLCMTELIPLLDQAVSVMPTRAINN